MKKTFRTVYITICFCLMTVGCAPYAYKKEIESFANSTKTFSAGIEEISADLRAQPGKDAFWAAYTQHDAVVSRSRHEAPAHSRALFTDPVISVSDKTRTSRRYTPPTRWLGSASRSKYSLLASTACQIPATNLQNEGKMLATPRNFFSTVREIFQARSGPTQNNVQVLVSK